MIDFIEKANLPKGQVKSLICGTDDRLILSFFEENNIMVYKNEKNNSVDSSVSSHADMSAIHLEKKTVLLDKNQNRLKEKLIKNGFSVFETNEGISGSYPADIRLNLSLISDCAVGNFRYADENLLKLISDSRKINVNQGYCKCSMLILNEKAVITDDSSIHSQMLKNGFDSLLIEKGDIYLEGHEYGFIGGTSGKIAENKVVFFGNIRKHCSFELIDRFLSKHRCSYVCTDNGRLRDIGGIIPLTEEY